MIQSKKLTKVQSWIETLDSKQISFRIAIKPRAKLIIFSYGNHILLHVKVYDGNKSVWKVHYHFYGRIFVFK